MAMKAAVIYLHSQHRYCKPDVRNCLLWSLHMLRGFSSVLLRSVGIALILTANYRCMEDLQ
jgi:hypothetical protein